MVSVAFLYAGDWMGKEVQEEDEEEGRLGRRDHFWCVQKFSSTSPKPLRTTSAHSQLQIHRPAITIDPIITPPTYRSMLTLLIFISLIHSLQAQNWGTSGKSPGYGKLKKSDAVLEDDIMDGKDEKYSDPTKPPEWLLNKKMLDPGLPTTPPPPPTMMMPPPEYDGENDNSAGGGLDYQATDNNGYLRGQGNNGAYAAPAFG
jgi:hypothetical protein